MRYFALGNKANIKITDDSLTLEDVKKDAIKMKIVTPEEAHQIREIKRDEFIKPIDAFKEPAPKPTRKQEQEEEEEEDSPWGVIPSWQSIVDELRINSTKEDPCPVERERLKKKRYYGR
jgi:hypothetical protein